MSKASNNVQFPSIIFPRTACSALLTQSVLNWVICFFGKMSGNIAVLWPFSRISEVNGMGETTYQGHLVPVLPYSAYSIFKKYIAHIE